MEILFMSNLFPKETDKQTRAKMRFDMYDAANVLQWHLVDGIEHNGGHHLSLINLLPVDSWPQKYKDAKVPRYVFEHINDARDINVGYCNVKYIKHLLLGHAYVAEVKKWEKETRGKTPRVVIAYSLNASFLKGVSFLKKKDPTIKALVVVADLPEFAAPCPGWLMKCYRKYNGKRIQRMMGNVDAYTLLTDQMAERMQITAPHMVMEGIAHVTDPVFFENKISSLQTVLYTGSMNKKYGVMNLVEAFQLIPSKSARLVLCGLGDAESEIRAAAERDGRISFLGKVPHEKVLALQSEATVVVNPRQNNEEFTKYSFPSKTMEYLASGVPVIAYKLDGIPDEYDSYIRYVPDNSPEALAQTITEVCEMSAEERSKIGARGRRFVLENKNATVQTKRILDFIQKCVEVSASADNI